MTLDSINPSTEALLGSVPVATQSELEEILKLASQTFLTWRRVPAPKRGEMVRALGDLLRAHKDRLGTLVSQEMGKSKQEGDGEVQEMIDVADHAVGLSRMLYGKTMSSERPGHRLYEQWHPLGPIGVITAFNFPVAVWAWNALIAVVCGDPVIWKPSPKTPLCALAVYELCQQVMKQYDCDGVFNLLITDEQKHIEQLVDDKRLPLISFTGSSAVGRHVGERVAARFGRSLLELSGNNAIIVDETADLNLAIPAIVFGAVGTAGQRCTTTRRLFLQASIFEETVTKLKNAYQQIDPKTLMGPLIDKTAVDRYLETIEQAKTLGGEIVFGGEALKSKGYFVQPTLVKHAENHWPILQRETFAPILYIMQYQTLEEAITLQNQVPQGLSSAIFTRNQQHAEQFLSETGSDCGIANVNIGTSGAEIGGAFGGEKETGGGREVGTEPWKAYMRRQTVTINYSDQLPLAQGIQFDLETK